LERALAEAELRRALELDPALVEARIRLAHVLSERGELAEAAALARTALETRLSAFYEVYAALVLGRSAVRLGHLDEARAAFDRAARLAPEAQAPRIGLTQVALAEGRAPAALAELTKVMDPARVRPTDDEWTVYFKVHEPDASTLMGAFRDRAR
jgi:tetratricopeptide (TPR) repeat protein